MNLSKSLIITILLSIMSFYTTNAKTGNKKPDFRYPTTVAKDAQTDIDAAKKAGNGIDLIEALLRFNAAQESISTDNFPTVYKATQQLIDEQSQPDIKALLTLVLVKELSQTPLRYNLRNNPDADDINQLPDDITEWSQEQFQLKTNALRSQLFDSHRQYAQFPLKGYSKIIENTDHPWTPTLADFILQQLCDHRSDNSHIIEALKQLNAQNRNILCYIECNYNNRSDNYLEIARRYADLPECALAFTHADEVDADTYSFLCDYLKNFPKSPFINNIKNLCANAEAKSVNVQTPENVGNKPFKVKCTVANANEFSLQIFKVKNPTNTDHNYALSDLQLVRTIPANVDGSVPFSCEKEVEIPALGYGKYVILPNFNGIRKRTTSEKFDVITVSDLHIMQYSDDANLYIFALDYSTGTPVKGATVTINFKSSSASFVTDSDGKVAIPKKKFKSNSARAHLSMGNDRFGKSNYLYYFSEDPTATRSKIDIFTDLAIYRPGETVKYNFLAYSFGIAQREPITKRNFNVALYDANYNLVDSTSVTSDESGRADGSFTLPKGLLGGAYSISVELKNNSALSLFNKSQGSLTARHHFEVSEYKSPTFAVAFDDARRSYTAGQPVTIKGNATTYSGMPLALTRINISLKEDEWSWFRGFGKDGNTIHTEEVTTDNQGRFTVTFGKELFDGKSDGNSPRPLYSSVYYIVEASCTDQAGETHEATTSFTIGKKRGLAYTGAHAFINDKPVKLPVVLQSTDETETAVDFRYTLADALGNIVAEGSLSTDRTQIDWTKLSSGTYKFSAKIIGDNQADSITETEILLLRLTDKDAPSPNPLWTDEVCRYVDSNNKAHIFYSTSAEVAHVYHIASGTTEILSKGWTKHSPGLHELVIDMPTGRNEKLIVALATMLNGRLHTHNFQLVSPINTDEVHVKVVTMRNITAPGKTEKWQLQLVDNHGNPHQGFMMLEMYNKALNALADNTWQASARLIPYSAFQNLQSNFRYTSYSGYSIINTLKAKYYQQPQLLQYSPYVTERVMFSKASSAPVMMACYGGVNGAYYSLKVSATEEYDLDVSSEDKSANSTTDFNAEIRTEEVKTALWLPRLVSDESGIFTIEFEVPNFNTTWILQALAYDKNIEIDKFRCEVLSQKPIMVKLNAPRFLRSGDTATLHALVQNAGDEALNCTAIIELFDPRTGKVVKQHRHALCIDEHGTAPVAIECSVPTDCAFIGVRIKAGNDAFADGEQAEIPVLPAVSPVIETTPFYINPQQRDFSITLPQFTDGSVTLEYCNNPVWYSVLALPTIFDGNKKISSSVAHNIWALAVAHGTANKYPEIRKAIDKYSAAEDSTLTSMLARNADLKITALADSPWLPDATRQSMRMHHLHELFDETSFSDKFAEQLNALSMLQNSDGGFPWYQYPNCQSSPYTTMEVLELIGELQKLGYQRQNEVINAIAAKALGYLDGYYKKLHSSSKKDVNYSLFTGYAYVCTLFPQHALANANKNIIRNTLKHMAKTWGKQVLSEKAFYALTFHRNGMAKEAADVIKSIREFGITKPATGTYWDCVGSGWSHNGKVGVTALILEAMTEIGASSDEIDQIRKWMLLEKQTHDWGSSSLAAHAIYSLLQSGSKWIAEADAPTITLGGKQIATTDDAFIGYSRTELSAAEASGMTLNVVRNGNNPSWGAVYNRFLSPMQKIKEHHTSEISISKEYNVYQPDGTVKRATGQFHVGDKVQVRCVVKSSRNLECVTIVDERPACFEPVNQLAGTDRNGDAYCYYDPKDSDTHIFCHWLDKGTSVITYDVYVTNEGEFAAGIATIQCQYAPQISAHSASATLTIAEK